MYEEMRLRPSGSIVKVYDIHDGMATIFDKEQFMKSDQGWSKVKVSKLVPMEFELHCQDVISNTSKNKARKRMHLEAATWKTSDGIEWDHSEIETAIEHELMLMEQENELKVSKNENRKE